MKRKGTSLAAGLALTLTLVTVSGAGASPKLNSFAGSCSVQGTVTFDPPATNAEQLLAVAYDAAGTCSGRLDGRQVTNAPVAMHHSGQSFGSCSEAKTIGPGEGEITFPDRTVIPYTFEFQSLGTEVLFDLYGQRSGTATGLGSFLTSRTSPDVVAECAGSGVAEIPMDLTLRTDSPLVSKGTSTTRTRRHQRVGG
jgi:hypothetical protein